MELISKLHPNVGWLLWTQKSKKYIGTDILHEEPIITSILKFWGSKSSYMVFKFNLVPNSPISQKEPGL